MTLRDRSGPDPGRGGAKAPLTPSPGLPAQNPSDAPSAMSASRSGADAGGGAFWAILEGAGAQVLSLGIFIILARFLAPADFGTVGLAMMLSEACVLALVEPVATTIVVRRTPTQDEYSTAFWLSLAVACLVVVAINLLAPLASRISGYDNLPLVLALLSPTVLLQAVSRVPEAWLTRAMQFRTLAIRRSIASVAGGVAGLLAVALHAGVFALVVQQVVGAAVGAAALWTLSPWRPALRLRRAALGVVGTLSVKLAPNSFATYVLNSFDAVAVGILAGATTGGIYNAAKRLRLAPQLVLVNALGRVTLSQFSRTATGSADLGETFIASAGMAMFLTLPLFVGASLVAPEICHLLLGPKWDGIAPIFAVLILMLPLGLLNNLFTNLYLIQGRMRLLTIVKMSQILVFTLAVMASAGHPAVVTAWATLVPLVIILPAMGALAASFTPFSGPAFLGRLAGPVGAGLGMAAAVEAVRPAMAEWAMAPRLLGLVGVGVAAYAVLSILLCRTVSRQAFAWLISRRRNGRGNPAAADAAG
jgi:O-antigen/teichoic acid export membrane protein